MAFPSCIFYRDYVQFEDLFSNKIFLSLHLGFLFGGHRSDFDFPNGEQFSQRGLSLECFLLPSISNDKYERLQWRQ